MTAKKELRVKYKQLRAALTSDEIEALSLEIQNKTLLLPIWDKNNYHIFLPIKQHNEINTEHLIKLLSEKSKSIVISRSNFETRDMTHFFLSVDTKILVNKYGIPEPIDGLEVNANQIDVIFVPLLAFDNDGHRVGYGKGFYDKFMATCRPDTIKVGLSFFEAEERCADVIESDVRLNYCVTPTKIYQL